MEELDAMRRDAEQRAQYLRQREKKQIRNRDGTTPQRRFQPKATFLNGDDESDFAPSTNSSPAKTVSPIKETAESDLRHTADAARMAALEFQVNGRRARQDIQTFVGPRWELDEEAQQCRRCNSDFDCINRRHHCRYCGKIYCGKCSHVFMILPTEFNQPDPQRVCLTCAGTLEPMQQALSQDVANHKRINYLDLGPGACRRYLNMPFALTLGSEIRKAAYSVINMFSQMVLKDRQIPLELVKGARGILFLTVAKIGMVIGARAGTGLVISRLPDDSWSAPSAVASIGVSWGLFAGGELTDYIIILNSEEALLPFTSSAQISIGAELAIAAGPIGRGGSFAMQMSERGIAPAYSYSHSRGAYVGASLDGCILLPRDNVNHRFYGMPFSPADMLAGRVERPVAAEPLYDALAKAHMQ